MSRFFNYLHDKVELKDLQHSFALINPISLRLLYPETHIRRAQAVILWEMYMYDIFIMTYRPSCVGSYLNGLFIMSPYPPYL